MSTVLLLVAGVLIVMLMVMVIVVCVCGGGHLCFDRDTSINV
jgi:hypothetical protein